MKMNTLAAMIRAALGAHLVRLGWRIGLKANFSQVPMPKALYNGTDFDLEEANRDGIQLLSADLAAANANGNGPDQENPACNGIEVVIDITAISGASATLTVIVEGKDPRSGKYYTLLQSAGLTAVATTVLQIYPGITVTANVTASRALPRQFRISYTITGTTPSVTAKISGCLLR